VEVRPRTRVTRSTRVRLGDAGMSVSHSLRRIFVRPGQ
jgi:hypothetical protein